MPEYMITVRVEVHPVSSEYGPALESMMRRFATEEESSYAVVAHARNVLGSFDHEFDTLDQHLDKAKEV